MMKKIKKIRIIDLLAIFKLILALPISYIYKLYRRNIWLICESGFEARDNGYWLFKYIKENEKNIDSVYVIDKKSPDYDKVKNLGEVVQFQSFKHWVYYLSAAANISSHKAGNPNPAVSYVLEVIFNFSKNRIFLQHGVTLSNATWLYYKNTKFAMFICAAKPEYKYIKMNFGYPEKNVKLLGFCRYDTLKNIKKKKKRILVMPSWRNWLVDYTDNQYVSNEEEKAFQKSSFFKYWYNFLSDKELIKLCEKKKIEIIFFPHRNFQPYLHLFEGLEYISLYSWENYDIQKLLREGDLLITDYSSVSLDFSYMEKPVAYYQFDYNDFREKQYKKGYFDYSENGFGPVFTEKKPLIDYIKNLITVNFSNEEKYKERIKDFFIYDGSNCERHIGEIKKFVERRN